MADERESLMNIIGESPGDESAVIVEIEGLQKIYDGKQRVTAVDGIDLRAQGLRIEVGAIAGDGVELGIEHTDDLG